MDKAITVMKASWNQKILMAVLNRHVLIFYNFILLGITVSVVIHLFQLLITPENDVEEMIKTCNGIAIILYGYGVALESRGPLMKFLTLYPRFYSQLQGGVDYLCHKFGIYILLLGLAEEILVHLVIIPNRVLNTEGKEGYIFSICFFILIIVFLLLVILSYNAVSTNRIQSMGKGQLMTDDE
jgi:hypothetical protein